MATKALPVEHGEKLSLYDLFIGLMTVMSLMVMAVQFLIPGDAVINEVLWIVDNLFCIIFLTDFTIRLVKAPSKIGYLKWQGTIDFLGSIPALPALRLFRLFRLARVIRLLRIGGPARILHEFVTRRSESALYVTITLALLVITLGSLAVYAVESQSPDANIKSGQDAVWWSIVTITTVGYGDRFPVTWTGRIIGMMTMITGIGIFAVFTSYMANLFIAPSSPAAEEEADESGAVPAVPTDSPAPDQPSLENQIAHLGQEIAELKAMLARQAG